MPVYLFWGEDDFAIAKAIQKLRESVLDPAWAPFNFEKVIHDRPEVVIEACNQALTPPFGLGERLVWLSESTLAQQCPDGVLLQLERTLPSLPAVSHLLITSSKKPDKRLRSTKLIEEFGQIKEFSPIPPWKTDELLGHVQKIAQEIGVQLTPNALKLFVDSVGNQTRQLWSELEKLALYADGSAQPIDQATVAMLVNASNQNSLQLAEAIRLGNSDRALRLVHDLLNQNEPALRIVATLVGQFRMWLWVKLSLEAGEKDEKAIAAAAEIANPKRIYFIRKEIQPCSSPQLLATLPLLHDLELGLKQGADARRILSAKSIELCQIFAKSPVL
jgi:DNA polymerase-3 subunit delta